MPGEEIRVLIADDHVPFLRTLRQIISGEPGIRIVAECTNGDQALREICETAPDVAVLDIEMPGLDGIGVAERTPPIPTRVILVTMHKDFVLLRRAREAGARGYVLKENAAFEVVPAIRLVAEGDLFAGQKCSAFREDM
jgi:two-component system response regulator DesR